MSLFLPRGKCWRGRGPAVAQERALLALVTDVLRTAVLVEKPHAWALGGQLREADSLLVRALGSPAGIGGGWGGCI